MQIVEYDKKYTENVKDLLVELQEFIVCIDDWKLNIMTAQYREEYFQKTMEQCLNENGVMFLAVENDSVQGLICGKINEDEKYDSCFYKCPKSASVEELIVSKNARACGIGSKLLEAIEKFFKDKGCEYCYIDVFEPNTNAIGFYDKKGYKTRMRTMGKKL